MCPSYKEHHLCILEMTWNSLSLSHNINQRTPSLSGPQNCRSIIVSSSTFLHSRLQCQPNDVGRPLLWYKVSIIQWTSFYVHYKWHRTHSMSLVTLVNKYPQLSGPQIRRSIIVSSCTFLHFKLQCRPNDVGRPLLWCNVSTKQGTSFTCIVNDMEHSLSLVTSVNTYTRLSGPQNHRSIIVSSYTFQHSKL